MQYAGSSSEFEAHARDKECMCHDKGGRVTSLQETELALAREQLNLQEEEAAARLEQHKKAKEASVERLARLRLSSLV